MISEVQLFKAGVQISVKMSKCGHVVQIMHLQVIDETLSPTWDELLVFDEILVYGRREDIKANPPVVIIEIYDQDKVGGPMKQDS